MEYYISDYLSAEFGNLHVRGNRTKKNKKTIVMSKETIETLFAKQNRRGPGTVLPNIIVLPRICNEPNRTMEEPSTSKIVNGKRATKAIFKSSMSPIISQSGDMDQKETSETIAAEKTQARKKFANRKPARPMVTKSRQDSLIGRPNVLQQSTAMNRSNERTALRQQTLTKSRSDSEQSSLTQSDNASNFEDASKRDLWHYNRQPEAVLTRRESICSSCGGAMSFSNSVSTRRFSTVSIEVPNENLMKNRFINEFAAKKNDSRSTSTEQSRPQIQTDEDKNKITISETRTKQDAAAVKEFKRIEKEKNLLYDLISVLYKKNFIKEEIRPYVRHALDICSMSTSDDD